MYFKLAIGNTDDLEGISLREQYQFINLIYKKFDRVGPSYYRHGEDYNLLFSLHHVLTATRANYTEKNSNLIKGEDNI